MSMESRKRSRGKVLAPPDIMDLWKDGLLATQWQKTHWKHFRRVNFFWRVNPKMCQRRISRPIFPPTIRLFCSESQRKHSSFFVYVNLIVLTSFNQSRCLSSAFFEFTPFQMSLLWRRIKRSNKKAAKFKYSISCKELLIECAHKWRPESIVVALLHRKRRYEIDPRRLEWSFDNPNQAMVLWPEAVREPLLLTTTLFRDQELDQFEDKVILQIMNSILFLKEWTLLIEEVTAKGKHKALAAVSINFRLFITDIPGTRMEAKFKLRPLRKEVIYCTVQFDISSKLLRETELL